MRPRASPSDCLISLLTYTHLPPQLSPTPKDAPNFPSATIGDTENISDAAEAHSYLVAVSAAVAAAISTVSSGFRDDFRIATVPAPSLALPRVPDWTEAGAPVPFLKDYFCPPPLEQQSAARAALSLSLQEAGVRLAALELQSQNVAIIPSQLGSLGLWRTSVEAWAKLFHPKDSPFAVTPVPALQRPANDGVFSALDVLGAPRETSVFATLASGLLNSYGLAAEPSWPDPIGGPNVGAAASLLTHIAADSQSDLLVLYDVFVDALSAAQASQGAALPGLHAVLASIEPLLLQPPVSHEAVARMESSRDQYEKTMDVLLFTSRVAQSLARAFEVAVKRASSRTHSADAGLAAALAFAGILSRVAVLAPDALLNGALGLETEASPRASLTRLRLQAFLESVIAEDAALPQAARAAPWQWHAVRNGSVSRAAADKSAAVGAPGVANASDAASIALRRHLLRLVAGPVPAMSALTEGYAVALAQPSRAVLAAVYLARFRRALDAIMRPLVPSGVLSLRLAEAVQHADPTGRGAYDDESSASIASLSGDDNDSDDAEDDDSN